MIGLSDLRVVSIEQYGAGPFGTLHLAELGAEVIKVEDARTAGDIGRQVPPFAAEDDSLFFQSFNRNKKSISLDLSTAAGAVVLHRLLEDADALVYNLRGDVPEKLGLRYEDLKTVNPRLVVCSLSGYGMTGPRRGEPAYDYVVQGLAGWMALTGDPDGPPTKSGLSLVDYCGGVVAAMSLLAGVHVARRDGVGGDCDVSLFDTAMSMLSYPGTWYLTAGHETKRLRRSSHPSVTPFGAYPTADGWLMLACVKPKFFVKLVEVLGIPELATDPRFATLEARRDNQAALDACLDDALRHDTSARWTERLSAAGVPCGPINDLPGAFEEEQVDARELVVSHPHPVWGEVRHVRTAGRGWWPAPETVRAPELGEHHDEILRGLLGYTDEELAALAADGAFGQA
ncbi:CaiB/BaiF CoA transferase family protein [Kribbella sp. NPDC048928]|uniref:CaiB/BaiF CoA transferase family protein n=1 Tax=Kribbella sp. NPDC048928 TaxID=3364111 RepID=UPI00371B08A1